MNVTAPRAHVSPTVETAPPGWAARKVTDLLASADVRIDGARPWDITVHDERLFCRLVLDGTVGLADGYVDGWWDCDAIDQLCDRLQTADVSRRAGFDRM